MFKKIGIILFFAGATLVVAHCLIGGAAFAQLQENGQPCPPECVTDSMEIITYYPSPYGYYEELRGDKIIVGDTDNSHIDETHLPPPGTITFEPLLDDPDASDGSLYEGSLYYQGAIGGTKGKFRFYDGLGWQDLGGDYWQLSGNNLYYSAGDVGVGVDYTQSIGARLQVDAGDASKKAVVIRGTAIETPCVSGTCTYDYTGGVQTLKAPQNINKITVTVYGGQGGKGYDNIGGGGGGMAQADISVTPGETLYIYVGGKGGDSATQGAYNGGGACGSIFGGFCGTGGGASDIRRAPYALSDRLIVAGGGGGGGFSDTNDTGGSGGAGGGTVGIDGVGGTDNGGNPGGRGGKGGTQSQGGAGGAQGACGGYAGRDGVLGIGGKSSDNGGGGGGGGYYGGGGAGMGCEGSSAGGGGGSSYIPAGGTTQSGIHSGNGQVVISGFSSAGSNLTEWQDANGNILSVVDASGKVGIGISIPSANLDVSAGKSTIADSWATRSSIRFKENIIPIKDALDKLSFIRGVYFDYKDSHKRSLGLVAEDVGKVFPELVTYEANGQDAISLDYDKLGAVTIEAIKEQQKEIEQLKESLRGQEEKSRENQERLRKQQKEMELLKAGRL